jgi:hypothetical protein
MFEKDMNYMNYKISKLTLYNLGFIQSFFP